jgi:hypothetical protein
MKKSIPKVGDRLIVHGMTHHKSIVESIEWNDDVYDWQVNLDWGEHGRSRVLLHDEHTVWIKYNDVN